MSLLYLCRYYNVSTDEFIGFSEDKLTAVKSELQLVPMKLTMAVLLPTMERRTPVFSVIHMKQSDIDVSSMFHLQFYLSFFCTNVFRRHVSGSADLKRSIFVRFFVSVSLANNNYLILGCPLHHSK